MEKKKLTLFAFILMIITSVFGVTNIGIGFYRMGYAAIPMFILGGALFFIPFIFMMIEFGTGFKNEKGGIFSWMEKSVSLKYAFIGIMMWYSSYVIWMFGKSMSMWVPLSFMLFGKDITINPVMVGATDIGPALLGVAGIILVVITAIITSYGPNRLSKVSSIGGLSVIALNIILIFGGLLVFVLNGFTLYEPLTAQALVTSPNPAYQSALPFLGFVVFAVFAYGGTEAMAGIADDLENPERDLKKGIYLAGLFIVICYVVGFLMVGAAMRWSDFPQDGSVSSLSALFLIVDNLGNHLAGPALGEFFKRFAGLGMFLSYLGAFISLGYAPLKQLMKGTPKEFWPESFQVENEYEVRVAPLKMQSAIVIAFIASKSLLSLIDPDGANALYELIITMTNVGMTIPYVFLIYAWYKYRQNDALEKDIVIIKDSMVTFAFVASSFLVIFGNAFTIVEPFVSGNYQSGFWTIVGPVLFSILALVIYNKSHHKIQK